MNLPAVLLACLALVAPFARAAAIYQWVDDQGRVQFSDTVPDRYKANAKEVEVKRFEPMPPARPDAQTRAARSPGASTPKLPDEAPNATASPPGAGAGAAAGRAQSVPIDAGAKKTDCTTLRRRYAESQRCFAPFVTAFGSVKAEAYAKCTPVPDPSPQCGIVRLP